MSLKNDLRKQIERYISFPENIIDEVIKSNCKNIGLLSEKQMADICAIRRNNLISASEFKYSLEELDMIIAHVDSNPFSPFAKLRDAISQIEYILSKNE